MSEMIAPEGMIFVCGACGKRSRGQYGTGGDKWWDESCSVNSVLTDDAPLDEPREWRVVLKSKHTPPRFLTEGAFLTKEKAEEARAALQANDPSFEYSVTAAPDDPDAEHRAALADLDKTLADIRASYTPKGLP